MPKPNATSISCTTIRSQRGGNNSEYCTSNIDDFARFCEIQKPCDLEPGNRQKWRFNAWTPVERVLSACRHAVDCIVSANRVIRAIRADLCGSEPVEWNSKCTVLHQIYLSVFAMECLNLLILITCQRGIYIRTQVWAYMIEIHCPHWTEFAKWNCWTQNGITMHINVHKNRDGITQKSYPSQI